MCVSIEQYIFQRGSIRTRGPPAVCASGASKAMLVDSQSSCDLFRLLFFLVNDFSGFRSRVVCFGQTIKLAPILCVVGPFDDGLISHIFIYIYIYTLTITHAGHMCSSHVAMIGPRVQSGCVTLKSYHMYKTYYTYISPISCRDTHSSHRRHTSTAIAHHSV